MSDKKIYIGRLSSKTRERDLEEQFGKYGKIAKLEFKFGFAFVVSLVFCIFI
jgi:arginine/serine-rich splicing factor 7